MFLQGLLAIHPVTAEILQVVDYITEKELSKGLMLRLLGGIDGHVIRFMVLLQQHYPCGFKDGRVAQTDE